MTPEFGKKAIAEALKARELIKISALEELCRRIQKVKSAAERTIVVALYKEEKYLIRSRKNPDCNKSVDKQFIRCRKYEAKRGNDGTFWKHPDIKFYFIWRFPFFHLKHGKV